MSSIQFGCQGCGQRLKVPVGSEGKQVRCPECETVNVIPSSGEPAPSDYAAPPIASPQPSQDENPFAAPNVGYEQRAFEPGNLTHQAINFGDVLEQAWERYKVQFGMCALFGIICIAIGIAANIGGTLANVAAQATESPPLVILTMIVGGVAQQIISAFQQVIGKRFGLNVVRGSSEPLTGIFSFDRVLPVIGLFLLIGVVMAVAGGIVVLPGLICGMIDQDGGPIAMTGIGISVVLGIALVIAFVIAVYRYFLALFFIVDRNASIFEAFEQSAIYMEGNKLQAFLISFVGGLLVGIVTVVTCGLGIVFALPFMEVLQAMIYSKATGQYQNFSKPTI